MSLRRTLVVLAVFALAAVCRADEIRTLSGKTIAGTVIAVDDKDLTVKTTDGEVKVPLADVLALDLRPVKEPTVNFTEIKLLDETVLRCKAITFKGNQLHLELLSKQKVSVPLKHVVTLQNGAQDAGLRKEFAALAAEGVKRDRVVINKDNALNPLEGTFGDVDAKGETIQFTFEGGDATPVPLSRLYGMIFFRHEPLKGRPVCYVYDEHGNSLAATKVGLKDNSFTITTVGGLDLVYDQKALARFDYNIGKLRYLSDLDPVHVVEKSGAGLLVRFRKDANLDGEPIFLDRAYPKGLSMHAYTELEFDLGGKYREFSAVLGVDPRVGPESQARVTIEFDGRKVFSEVITAKAVRALPEAARNVSGVRRLRITVSSQNILDLHDHVTIADPKITQ